MLNQQTWGTMVTFCLFLSLGGQLSSPQKKKAEDNDFSETKMKGLMLWGLNCNIRPLRLSAQGSQQLIEFSSMRDTHSTKTNIVLRKCYPVVLWGHMFRKKINGTRKENCRSWVKKVVHTFWYSRNSIILQLICTKRWKGQFSETQNMTKYISWKLYQILFYLCWIEIFININNYCIMTEQFMIRML